MLCLLDRLKIWRKKWRPCDLHFTKMKRLWLSDKLFLHGLSLSPAVARVFSWAPWIEKEEKCVLSVCTSIRLPAISTIFHLCPSELLELDWLTLRQETFLHNLTFCTWPSFLLTQLMSIVCFNRPLSPTLSWQFAMALWHLMWVEWGTLFYVHV